MYYSYLLNRNLLSSVFCLSSSLKLGPGVFSTGSRSRFESQGWFVCVIVIILCLVPFSISDETESRFWRADHPAEWASRLGYQGRAPARIRTTTRRADQTSDWPVQQTQGMTFLCKHLQRVHSISFPGSTPVCPRYARIALTSFHGLTRVSPKCPACGVGHFWAGPRCMTSLRERWVIVRLLTWVSTAGSTRGC